METIPRITTDPYVLYPVKYVHQIIAGAVYAVLTDTSVFKYCGIIEPIRTLPYRRIPSASIHRQIHPVFQIHQIRIKFEDSVIQLNIFDRLRDSRFKAVLYNGKDFFSRSVKRGLPEHRIRTAVISAVYKSVSFTFKDKRFMLSPPF